MLTLVKDSVKKHLMSLGVKSNPRRKHPQLLQKVFSPRKFFPFNGLKNEIMATKNSYFLTEIYKNDIRVDTNLRSNVSNLIYDVR